MIEPGVRIIGNVEMGADVSIAAPSEIMAKDSSITIGAGSDIASYVVISTADSHARCIGLLDTIERLPIVIGERVFIGTGARIFGGTEIGDGSVIGANVVLKGDKIPPHSRVRVPWPTVEPNYYARFGRKTS